MVSSAGYGLYFTLQAVEAYVAARRSQDWPAVPVTVEECLVKKKRGNESGDYWVVKVKYRYRVGEEEFHGTRMAPLPVQTRSARTAEELEELYRPGSEVTVFYDPTKPRRAMLGRGLGEDNYVALAYVPLVWLVCFMVVKFHPKGW